ncbi:hypothetical protein RIF29_42056 [Crotalaria pallida]|uniref:RING-CH-type domain-containing protein n=1 Tax=Crotalaria pallida TaxID=3830 RepID=A0AAN9E6M3_CROPI
MEGSDISVMVMDYVVGEGVDENLSHLVEEGVVTIAAGAGSRLSERDSVNREDGTLEKICNNSGLNKEVKDGEEPQEVKGHGICYQQKINEEANQGTSCNSRNLDNGEEELEIYVENLNGDNGKLKAKVNESGLSKVPKKVPKGVVVCETDKSSCVIDVKCGSCKGLSGNLEGEMICRICHIPSGQPLEATAMGITNSATSTALIRLGCACKDELGVAHSHCAEAWFKLKGNRLCEICGETVKNVSGVTDNGFMQEWNEIRFIGSGTSSGMFGGWWRGQPFCNLLMVCLVIAFVLPWFFRIKML